MADAGISAESAESLEAEADSEAVAKAVFDRAQVLVQEVQEVVNDAHLDRGDLVLVVVTAAEDSVEAVEQEGLHLAHEGASAAIAEAAEAEHSEIAAAVISDRAEVLAEIGEGEVPLEIERVEARRANNAARSI